MDCIIIRTWLFRCFTLIALITLLASGLALANGLDYTLPWWTADGGGGTSSGGSYTLSGTIGQPDAGLLQGGEYTLGGGFWGGGILTTPGGYSIYLPLSQKS